MSMSALSWHDDRSPRELARWAIAAAVVLGAHAGALIYLLAVHEPDVVGSNMDVVTVELAPIDSTPDALEQNLAPAPETMVESSPLPDLPKPQEQPKEEVKLERQPDEAPAEVRCRSKSRRRRFRIRRRPRQLQRSGSRAVRRKWNHPGRRI